MTPTDLDSGARTRAPAGLVPLPPQPAGVPWPGERWPLADLASRAGVDAGRVKALLDAWVAGHADSPTGETHAVAVVHRGELVAEAYDAERGPDVTCVSWSMAKSITHALAGVLVREGRLDLHAPAPVPAWSESGDPRGRITVEMLLRMVDGLDFVEEYVPGGVSHVIDMLFQAGKQDVAGYAAARPLAHPPGSFWSYSSGTTNIVAAILGRVVGGGAEGMQAFMSRELFDPIGMRSAKPRFDDAGTFIGSSFVFATARDFARFGLLYLRDGVWGAGDGESGRRILPPGWVDHARTPTPASRGEYGAHWWLAMDGSGIFTANGYRGQYTIVDPTRDLVVVRLGGSTPEQRANVVHGLAELVRAFPRLEGAAA